MKSRPTKKTYNMKRDLQKRPTKETYECDLLTLAYLNELPNVRHMPRAIQGTWCLPGNVSKEIYIIKKRPTKESYKCDLLTLAYLSQLPSIRDACDSGNMVPSRFKRDLRN